MFSFDCAAAVSPATVTQLASSAQPAMFGPSDPCSGLCCAWMAGSVARATPTATWSGAWGPSTRSRKACCHAGRPCTALPCRGCSAALASVTLVRPACLAYCSTWTRWGLVTNQQPCLLFQEALSPRVLYIDILELSMRAGRSETDGVLVSSGVRWQPFTCAAACSNDDLAFRFWRAVPTSTQWLLCFAAWSWLATSKGAHLVPACLPNIHFSQRRCAV
jgi:hypothetical protein